MKEIRNIAIIAHVDHGKTTLIDSLLSQSGAFHSNQEVDERIMDHNDLEKERGITILAKCTSIEWENVRINIIDTPGHADFGGEVERVLSMTDGVILLVDASEGPMPQTKFVLSKAIQQGLKPIVVINKIDKPDNRPDAVIDEVFDLFTALEANEEQLDFPILYASGRDGWCIEELGHPKKNLEPLLNKILHHVERPDVDLEKPFSMLVTLLDSDPFLGRMLTGRIYTGKAKINMPIHAMNLAGEIIETGRLTKLQSFKGLQKVPTEEAAAGDIICIAGMEKTSVSDTIASPEIMQSIQSTPIDPPTMSIYISVNDSPLAGLEGKKLTSRMIRERLFSEAETNVGITIQETENKNAFEVAGRGELQLGVLIETMRREGFELSVSRPRVLFKKDLETGKLLEPIEEIVIDVDEEFSGVVVEKISQRKGQMIDMRPSGAGKTRIIFLAPSRGLIGYQSEFLTDTKGTGTMNRLYHKHDSYKGEIEERRNGVLIALSKGKAVGYSLFNLQERGTLFIKPQDEVYPGMIVGENSRNTDLEVNVLKGKQLTNVRASGSDEAIRLTPPVILSLEQMISYIQDDELLEVTPNNLRLRKRFLDSNERKKHEKKKKKS